MKISIKTLIHALISIVVALAYINFVGPVGWFDSVFGVFLGVLVFFLLKKFKGITLK